MIRVLNLPNSDSDTEGWKISIDNKSKYPFKLGLVSGNIYNHSVDMYISPDDYEKLTHPNGIDIYAASKLISIKEDIDSDDIIYMPLLKSANDPAEDSDISFIHFETDIGCVISDVKLSNCKAISYFVGKSDLYMSVTICVITTDLSEPASIDIRHGYLNGKNLSIENIAISHKPVRTMFGGGYTNGSVIQIGSSVMSVDMIARNDNIKLPLFDISSVAIAE